MQRTRGPFTGTLERKHTNLSSAEKCAGSSHMRAQSAQRAAHCAGRTNKTVEINQSVTSALDAPNCMPSSVVGYTAEAFPHNALFVRWFVARTHTHGPRRQSDSQNTQKAEIMKYKTGIKEQMCMYEC